MTSLPYAELTIQPAPATERTLTLVPDHGEYNHIPAGHEIAIPANLPSGVINLALLPGFWGEPVISFVWDGGAFDGLNLDLGTFKAFIEAGQRLVEIAEQPDPDPEPAPAADDLFDGAVADIIDLMNAERKQRQAEHAEWLETVRLARQVARSNDNLAMEDSLAGYIRRWELPSSDELEKRAALLLAEQVFAHYPDGVQVTPTPETDDVPADGLTDSPEVGQPLTILTTPRKPRAKRTEHTLTHRGERAARGRRVKRLAAIHLAENLALYGGVA